jgi:hypothetical protein
MRRYGGFHFFLSQQDYAALWSGVIDDSIKDTGLVALSFLRAHASVLEKRYGFYLDPRIRCAQDWLLGVSPVDTPMSGGSVGAAIASTGYNANTIA